MRTLEGKRVTLKQGFLRVQGKRIDIAVNLKAVPLGEAFSRLATAVINADSGSDPRARRSDPNITYSKARQEKNPS